MRLSQVDFQLPQMAFDLNLNNASLKYNMEWLHAKYEFLKVYVC